MNYPVVFLDRTLEGAPSVSSDGYTGGKLAAQAIIHGKSQRITLLRGPAHLPTAQDRFNGALEILKQAEVDFQVIETASFSIKDAQSMAKELFASYPATDGVIASNDIQAAAVLHEALRRGKTCRRTFKLSAMMTFRKADFCSRHFLQLNSPHMIWERSCQTAFGYH